MRASAATLLLLLLVGVADVLVGLLSGHRPSWILLGVGLSSAVAAAALLTLAADELVISPEGVSTHRRLWRARVGTRHIGADAVRRVLVGYPGVRVPVSLRELHTGAAGASGESKQPQVLVLGKGDLIWFGAELQPESKEWIRDCVVYVLTVPPERTTITLGHYLKGSLT